MMRVMSRGALLLVGLLAMFSNSGGLVDAGVVNRSSNNNYNLLMTLATVPTALPTSPSRVEPYFDTMSPRNVTALVGKSAYLTCRVRNLGNKTVSWIRHRDIHILTVSSYTYTSDQRFQANHHPETDEWTLQIKWAQKRDAGVYECQISTQPVRSYSVTLNVVDLSDNEDLPESERDKFYSDGSDSYHKMFADQVPTATILGGPDLHVDKGSTINLTCSIRFSPEPPAYIFWYHHDDVRTNPPVISYDSSRGGVSVITEKGEITTSYLLIQHADLSDSGKYSCSPSNADVASVRVHVLNGEFNPQYSSRSSRISTATRTAPSFYAYFLNLGFSNIGLRKLLILALLKAIDWPSIFTYLISIFF